MSQVTLEYAERAEYTLSPERFVVESKRIRPCTLIANFAFESERQPLGAQESGRKF